MDYKPDKKAENMIENIVTKLQNLLNKKVECRYLIDRDISNKPDFAFCIYDDEGYKEVYLEQAKYLPVGGDYSAVDYYVSIVIESLNNGTYDEYLINAYERLILDKIKENGCTDLYIIDNKLYEKGNYDICIYMDDIYSIYYNADEAVLIIGTDTNDIFEIDLDEETIKILSDEEIKEIINE